MRLTESFFFIFSSILFKTAPNKNSGRPVREFTIYLTSCRKLQNGLSKTIFFTFLEYLAEYNTAVTAPIDLPHKLTF